MPDKFSSTTPGHDKKSVSDIVTKNVSYGYEMAFPDEHWLMDGKFPDFFDIGFRVFAEKEDWTTTIEGQAL